MNDLQLSLLGIGVLVIAGVVVYNGWQERRFRKLAQERFRAQRDDVLLGGEPAGQPSVTRETRGQEERVEPTLSTLVAEDGATAEAAGGQGAVAASAGGPEGSSWPDQADGEIGCVVRLELAEPAVASQVRAALADAQSFDKPVRWFGRLADGEWRELEELAEDGELTVVVGTLQLADRAGPVSGETLDAFLGRAQEAAARLMAVAQLPEKAPTLARAQALDQFCAEVDVLVGVNVVAVGQGSFPGTKLRALAEAAGLRLAGDGTFQYRDEHGQVLYALANQEPAPFEADTLRHLSTHGVTLLFDVPRVAGGLRAFDQMMLFAHQLADSLKGTLVDDNLRPLTEEGVARIRQQLAALYRKMDARGIAAGSVQAMRLFS